MLHLLSNFKNWDPVKSATIASLVFASLAIVFALRLWVLPLITTPEKPRVSEAKGSWQLVRLGQTRPVKPGLLLEPGDRLIPEPDAETLKLSAPQGQAFDFHNQESLFVTATEPRLAVLVTSLSRPYVAPTTKNTPDIEAPAKETPTKQTEGPQHSFTQALEEQVPLLQKCHARVISTTKDFRGKVLLSFLVHPDGHPREIKVAESQFSNDEFHACLIRVLERTRFPEFSGPPVQTNFPLSFR